MTSEVLYDGVALTLTRDPCEPPTSVTVPSMTPQTYTLAHPKMTITLPAFTTNSACTTALKYVLTIPTFCKIVLDRTISCETSSAVHIGDHIITMVAQTPGGTDIEDKSMSVILTIRGEIINPTISSIVAIAVFAAKHRRGRSSTIKVDKAFSGYESFDVDLEDIDLYEPDMNFNEFYTFDAGTDFEL